MDTGRRLWWPTGLVVGAVACAAVLRGAPRPTQLVLAALAVGQLVGAVCLVRARWTPTDTTGTRADRDPYAFPHAELAAVVHELRNPLASVRGFLETLHARGADLDPSTRDHIQEIALRNALLLGHRVDTLLEFERLAADSVAVSPHRVALGPSVSRIVQDAEGLLVRHEVDVDIPEDLAAMADEDALSHVLVNLLSNAAKHAPEGSLIRVAGRSIDGTVELRVSDRGPGIDQGDVAHVFEPFYRARGQAASGAGIGLSVVRRFVDLLGGAVSIESAPGEGTTVVVRLPAGADAPRPTGSPPPP